MCRHWHKQYIRKYIFSDQNCPKKWYNIKNIFLHILYKKSATNSFVKKFSKLFRLKIKIEHFIQQYYKNIRTTKIYLLHVVN